MNRERAWLGRVAAVASLISFSNAAFADEAGDQARAEQDAKQASLNQRSARVSEVAQAYGRYTIVRDTMYQSPNGVKALAEAFYTAAAEWTAAWSKVTTVLTLASDLSRPTVRDTLNQLLQAQTKAWADLNAQADRLRDRTTEAQNAAATIAKFPAAYVPGYEGPLGFYNTQATRLVTAITSTSTAFSSATRTGMQEVLSETERVVDLALKIALASSPELHAAVDRAHGLLRAEREVRPRLRRVSDLYDKLSEDVVSSRLFQAQDRVVQLIAEAERAEREIGQLGLDAEFTSSPLRTIRNMKIAGPQMIRDSLDIFPHGDTIADLFAIEGQRISAMCRDDELRKQVNCQLFRTVFSIPQATIRTLNDTQLRNLEMQIARVNAGPVAEGSNTP